MSSPLKLNDDELDAVFLAARPLQPQDRDPFLQRIAELLRDCGEVGPGDVNRAIRAAQKEFFDPPNLERQGTWSKYA